MKIRRYTAIGFALTVASVVLPVSVWAVTYSFKSTDLRRVHGLQTAYDPNTGFYTDYLDAYADDQAAHVPGGGPTDSTYGYVFYQTYDAATGELCYGYTYDLTDHSISPKLDSASIGATVTLDCYDTNTIDPATGYYYPGKYKTHKLQSRRILNTRV